MITDHPGPWQHFSLRSDNRGLSIMELKSKYINEQYLFEAQMAQIQHQHNIFMNGGGGGLLPTSTTPPVVITDPDVLAFIAATGITDNTQKSAINSLVISLKGYSIWNKLYVIYPFVGGTAFTNKFNLKDPRDLDAAYRLSFSGGWTHNDNGITGNGTNTLANTFFNPGDPIISTLGVYARTGTAGQTFMSSHYYTEDEGFYNGPFGINFKTDVVSLRNNFDLSAGPSPYTKGYTVVDTGGGGSNTAVKVYRNGTDINSTHQPNIWNFSELNPPITIGALRADYYDPEGIFQYTLYTNYSTSNIAFAYMGYIVLNATEAANLNTAIVAYQTTLSRQV